MREDRGARLNHRAVVEYDGTDYSGFQIQPDRPTIQGELERALERVTQEPVRVDGAGRTDAGVHARGQVIGFRTAWPHGPAALQRAINAVLPRDISVRDVSLAHERFHARFSAKTRTYVYTIYSGHVRAPLLARYAHHVPERLDREALRKASDALRGEHDFAAFGQAPSGQNTVRAVHRAEWRIGEASAAGIAAAENSRLLRFEIEANAFLRGMVRRIVGTLLLVGRGVLTVSDFAEILSSRDISQAGAPAPACGLCLWRVDYGEGVGAPSHEDEGAPVAIASGSWGMERSANRGS